MSVFRTDLQFRRRSGPAPRLRPAAVVLGLILAAAITATPATALLADPPQLHLADLVPVQESGGAVRWTVGEPIGVDDPGSFEKVGFLTTTTRSWRLGVRPQVSFRDTGYYLDVYARHRSRGDVYRFKVRAEAEGQFRDCLALVPFELEEASDGDPLRVEGGKVEMPIHQPAPSTFVTAEPEILDGGSEWRVHLGEANDLKITVSNALNAEVELQPHVDPDSDNWSSLEFVDQSEDGLIRLPAESKEDLVLRGEPKSLSVLLRSVLPREDQGLTINLRPTSLGRRGERLDVPLVVRYVPSTPLLASVLFLGVLLGCLCRLAFSPQPWRPWLRLLAASLLLSLIVWIVAIGLHAAQSKLELFGFEINPLDVVGVSLIGIAVGFGGKKVVSWVEKRFGLGDEAEESSPEQPPERPAESAEGTSAEGRA